MTLSTVELLENLRQFIQNEAENQRHSIERQWSRPIAERVYNGWAIEGLRLVKVDEKTRILNLLCATNESRFREGDLLILHRGNPRDPNALHVELEYDGEMELEVSLQKGNLNFMYAEPEGWIADQDFLDMSDLYLQALDKVADTQLGRSVILPLLSGALQPQLDFARYERAEQAARNSNLNDSQVEAIAQAYATNLVHLVQGPPGTGKTVLLAHLVRLYVEEGKRVLVTALTHRAINNALNKIAAVDPDLPVCKIGEERQASDLHVANYETFDQSRFGDLPKGYAVGATPFSTMSKRLSNVEFDVVVFDEASQVTLPLAIMGMLAGGQYVFIGDQNQLPPVTTSDGMLIGSESIFGYLSGRGYETMLNITYRMNDVLSDWPSRTFYHGALQPTQDAGRRRLGLSSNTTRWDFVLDPASPAVFLDLCHRNTTVRSRTEAQVVVDLLLSLLEHGIPPYDIGVVVPYRAQSRLIRSLLRRALPDDETLRHLVIDTVERMQGQEREVVLVSFTTASPGFAAWVAEFFFQPQRLNVAVTRPRTKLILVGSRHMLEAKPNEPELAEQVELLRDLIASCYTFTIPDGSLA